MKYRDWAGFSINIIPKVRPGPCHYARKDGGTEDLTYIGDGIFIASGGYKWNSDRGEILSIDVNDETSVMTPLTITDAPNSDGFMVRCHGISAWRDPESGTIYLYVLTHPESADRVEVFEVVLKGLHLRHIRSIVDPSFTFMKDLVAVGRDQFYITRYNWFRSFVWIRLSHWLHIPEGPILFYDGGQVMRALPDSYFLPNGINASPDKKTIYMAELGTKTIHALQRDDSNKLTTTWKEYVDSAVDNIEVDKDTGDLWIGSHPITFRIVDFFGWFGKIPASQVLRIKIRDGVMTSLEEIYADDGDELNASTVAAYGAGKLVIGSLFTQTVVCDVKYLTK
ncbi:serum paraoxonase/arylesterase 2-like isoform X3 [Mya arenaria]|nr:serum paraoxonase/arylesterase 2-like isoform X2 [Mya arenaria]XP_052776583.1 serum paraoxonase/arylesterase 2-like isoform X3 [Mya arenaria]